MWVPQRQAQVMREDLAYLGQLPFCDSEPGKQSFPTCRVPSQPLDHQHFALAQPGQVRTPLPQKEVGAQELYAQPSFFHLG